MPAENILPNLADESTLGTQTGSCHGSIGGGTTRFRVKSRYFGQAATHFGREHVDQQFTEANYVHPISS